LPGLAQGVAAEGNDGPAAGLAMQITSSPIATSHIATQIARSEEALRIVESLSSIVNRPGRAARP
jgi:hypothetical protein